MVCQKSNVSDFIVKQLYIGAHSDGLGSVKGEVSSRTRGRSIVFGHHGVPTPIGQVAKEK